MGGALGDMGVMAAEGGPSTKGVVGISSPITGEWGSVAPASIMPGDNRPPAGVSKLPAALLGVGASEPVPRFFFFFRRFRFSWSKWQN